MVEKSQTEMYWKEMEFRESNKCSLLLQCFFFIIHAFISSIPVKLRSGS